MLVSMQTVYEFPFELILRRRKAGQEIFDELICCKVTNEKELLQSDSERNVKYILMLTRRPSSFKRSDSSAPSAVTKTYGDNHIKRCCSLDLLHYCRSRMGPIYEGFLHVYRGRLFAKWRRFMGAVFDENSTGHARLELYGSDKQLSTVNPARVVLLSECIAIRIVTFEKNERVIQIQQKTAPVMLIISEDIEKWHEILCRVAFPNQFVAIGTQPCSSVSPCYSGDYSIPADVRRIPVVLQCISGTSRPQLSEGNYDMYLNQSLVITSGMHSVTWDYLQITWFATGDNCFAFEIAKEGRYEFTSSQPMVPLHALRCHISLTNITTPPRFLTKNRYNYFYIPSSAIRSDSISSRPNFAQSEQQNSPKSRGQPLPSSIASGYDINTHLMNQQSNFESHRTSKLPFFHRHPDHSNWYERADFEMNADDEWIR
ncbi:unnamed protein product [Anisakis simplex]|uniref:PH domain-containing protein n=1 Tax=Anisakis simplex TaxID=6269 RepID=A0A0M3K3W6_ANISI|nr:unnamed protein product [Anisakis simplex]